MPSKNTRVRSVLALLFICLAVVASSAVAPGAIPYLRDHRGLVKSARAWLRGAQFLGEDGVVLQPKWNQCGAACLKMVLAAHGISREVSDLAVELRTTGPGTSLLDLRMVSTSSGLPARSWMLSAPDLGRVPLPAVAFVYGDHFVVIPRLLAPDAVEVNDPALGHLRWPIKSFSKAWSGETLVFDPAWSPA